MAKDDNDNISPKCSTPKEDDSNKSFVKKVSLRVSGFIPSSLSKWFSRDNNRSSVRYREEDEDDDESYAIQPPSKRVKLPSDPAYTYNNFSFTTLSTATENRNPPPINYIPEPVAGPSGLCSRKLLLTKQSEHDFVNGDKDSDSGDSTSGYSSMARIGSKEQVSESNEQLRRPINHVSESGKSGSRIWIENYHPEEKERSLFSDRSLTPSNTSLSSRRPSFSASTFGSPNFVDRTLSTKQVLNSPFYSGQTVYGGASAYARKLGRTNKETNLFRSSVHVKPANQKSTRTNTTLSKTARRILDTLEQYTTPVLDAQRIPQPVKTHKQESLLSRYTGVNPYLREQRRGPTKKELQVPTVTELLKMKEQLQDSTESVRHIAASSKSDLNKREYRLKEPDAVAGPSKHRGKMKTKVSAVRQHKADAASETVEEVKLPNVALPISTLPKFDFSFTPPPPFTTKSDEAKVKAKAKVEKVPEKTDVKVSEEEEATEFKFSKPLVLAENLKSIISINNFTFSEPILKKPVKTTSSVGNFVSPTCSELKLKKLPVKNNGEIQTAAQLITTGSVMDILGKKDAPPKANLMDAFKPPEGHWECTVCLVRNKPDADRCIACTTMRSKPTETEKRTAPSVTNLLKPATDTAKCVDCQDATAKSTSLFSLKFKPPSDTWECPTCMIRNKDDFIKCAACETAKPGAKKGTEPLAKVVEKKKEEQWECGTCMVRNSMDKLKCPCCETPKPGQSKGAETGRPPVFSFGIEKTASNFVFGLQPNMKVDTVKTNASSIFGENAKPVSEAAAPSTFTFGIKPAPETKPVAAALKPTPKPTEKTSESAANIKEPTDLSLKQKVTPTPAPMPNFVFTPNAKPESVIPAQIKETTTVAESATNKFSYVFSNPTPLNAEEKTAKVAVTAGSFFGTVPTKEPPTTTLFSAPDRLKRPAEASTVPFAFGNAQTNSFGTPPPQQKDAEKKPFTFNASSQSQEPPTKMPMFNFGQKSTEAPLFGGSVSTSTSTTSFNFGGEKEKLFAFGATANGTTTAVQNGGFNFGATPVPVVANDTAKAGFSFGSSDTQPPMFNFSAGSSGSTASGFNFGASSTPAFNANAKPVFNFTQGGGTPAMFSAQPNADGPTQQRKVRKALRRANRQ